MLRRTKLTCAAPRGAVALGYARAMRSPRAPLSPVLLALIAACAGNSGDTATQGVSTSVSITGVSDGSTSDPSGTSGETSGAPTSGSPTTTTGEPGGTSGESSGTSGGPTSSGTTGDDSTGDPLADLELQETFDGGIANGWAKVERWKDPNPAFIQEDRFALDMRASQTGQRLEFFGGDPAPHSSVFLLYYAPGWDQAKKSTPILLAHGANDQADRAWANPGESGDFGCGQSTCPDTGLMQSLSEQGYSVFAISHPHSQGDNYFWAEQIHDAITIVRARTGAAKVDLVGWSKGVMSSRMYSSSLTEAWGTPYQNDVRKLVLIGGPNLGFDYIFRYGTAHNAGIYADYGGKIHAPGPHDELLIFGAWVDRADYGIFKSAKGDNYRGQIQMLARWDAKYPLTGTANNGLGSYVVGDSESTYVGETKAKVKGLYARGKGIDVAIAQGSVIAPMVAAGIPASIETYLLCGDLDLQDNSKLIPGLPNEIAGPSDGIVFVDSCAAKDGIGNLAGTAVLKNVNHLQLGWHGDSVAKLVAWLGN